MGYFRNDKPAPIAWPPSNDVSTIKELIAFTAYRDPIGHALHVIAGLTFLFSLPFATSISSSCYGALMFVAIIRIPWGWRCVPPLLKQPILGMFVLWTAWTATTLLWSNDPHQGLIELRAMRMLSVPLALWPLLAYGRWLIAAAMIGVFAQNIVQALQMMGYVESDGDSRFPGLIHPIQTGAWCTVAMLFNASAFARTRGTWRWISVVLLIGASFGLVASGSRGAWIAAAITIPPYLLIEAWRRPAVRIPLLAALVAGIATGGILYSVEDSMVQRRVNAAIEDARLAVEEQEYWTSTGLRIGQWKWSLQITNQSPIFGLGAGSFEKALHELPDYRDAVERAKVPQKIERPVDDRGERTDRREAQRQERLIERAEQKAAERAMYMDRAHNHSTLLHVLSMQGVIGAMIVLWICFLIVRDLRRFGGQSPYRVVMPWAFAAWFVGAQFDCYHLNGHLLGLFAMLATFALIAPEYDPIEKQVDDNGDDGIAPVVEPVSLG